MMDKATGRVVAVIVLLIAIAASLRGYLPGVEHAGQQRPPHSGSSLLYVAALLTVSLVIVAVALITRLRDPRRVASSASPLSDRISRGHGRPAWRVLLIGAAVLLAWLLLVWLLSQFVGPAWNRSAAVRTAVRRARAGEQRAATAGVAGRRRGS